MRYSLVFFAVIAICIFEVNCRPKRKGQWKDSEVEEEGQVQDAGDINGSKEEVEDDSGSEEDSPPPPKSLRKSSKRRPSNPEEEESEEEHPPPPPPKNLRKSWKRRPSNPEEDENEDDSPPKWERTPYRSRPFNPSRCFLNPGRRHNEDEEDWKRPWGRHEPPKGDKGKRPQQTKASSTTTTTTTTTEAEELEVFKPNFPPSFPEKNTSAKPVEEEPPAVTEDWGWDPEAAKTRKPNQDKTIINVPSKCGPDERFGNGRCRKITDK